MAEAHLEAALDLARRLGPIFPCRGKLPAIAKDEGGSGVLDATTDEATIRAWWRRDPSFNIGLACGVSFFAIDLDEKPGISGRASFALLEERYGYLEATVEQVTPTDGRHILLQVPKGVEIRNSAGKLGPGIDTRGVNGYILAAPSVHPVTGTRYEWHPDLHPDRIPIAMPPEWLVKLLCEGTDEKGAQVAPPRPRGRISRYAEGALDGAVKAIVSAPAGEQHATLNREGFAIGGLVAGGVIPSALALESLTWAAQQMPSHDGRRPWRPAELQRQVRDAFLDGLQHPREVPRT